MRLLIPGKFLWDSCLAEYARPTYLVRFSVLPADEKERLGGRLCGGEDV
jgi:hypothetical protein